MSKRKSFSYIQQPVSDRRLPRREPITLAVDNVAPIIRIAHRVQGAMHIRPRVIFDHELILIRAGGAQVRLGRQSFDVQPVSVVFVPPFVAHTITSDDGPRHEHVAIHFDFAPGTPPYAAQPRRRKPYEVRLSHGLRISPCIAIPSGHALERDILSVLDARAGAEPWANLRAANAMTRALLHLFKLSGGSKPASPGEHRNRARLQRAITLMESRYADDLTAEDLAGAAGLSVSHFNRLFQAWTGVSPMAYLRRLRVDRARALLADVDMTIKEIAAATGFVDPYHFSKVFHQEDGLSPSSYREALLAGR